MGTPSFLRILLDKAEELGVAVSFTKAFVSGEAFPPSVREAFAARGIEACQAYATADIGLIAYETPAREGMVVDEDILLEIVRPGTGDPIAPGEVGEVRWTAPADLEREVRENPGAFTPWFKIAFDRVRGLLP